MAVDVKVTLQPNISKLWFEKRELKAAIRLGARQVQKEARRLVARRAISAAGDFPGYDTGTLSKAIKIKVGSGGGYARVEPQKTAAMEDYYPAFLHYGTSRGLKPRKNYMTAALNNKQGEIRRAIKRSLIGAIKVGTK